MYARPENAAAHHRLWQIMRDALHDKGVNAPDALSQDMSLWELWRAPDLLLTQTCSLPYRAELHTQVTLVGAPQHLLPELAPGNYCSVFITHKHQAARPLGSFSGCSFAYNEPLSHSGWAAPYAHATEIGLRFGSVLRTGSHRASALAVAEGAADLAAIDIVTWSMIRRWDSFATDLSEVAQTAPTPALPFICAPIHSSVTLRHALHQALMALNSKDQADLGLCGIVEITPAPYLALPIPPQP